MDVDFGDGLLGMLLKRLVVESLFVDGDVGPGDLICCATMATFLAMMKYNKKTNCP